MERIIQCLSCLPSFTWHTGCGVHPCCSSLSSVLFVAQYYSVVWAMLHLVYLFIDGCTVGLFLGRLCACLCVEYVFLSVRQISRCGVVGPYDKLMFIILRNGYTVFQCGCTVYPPAHPTPPPMHKDPFFYIFANTCYSLPFPS